MGDSISAGYGIDPNVGWVKLLEYRLAKNKYNYRVINASISGDTLSNGLDRMPKALAEYKPQITIIELGANDGLRGLQISQIKTNLQKLIALAENAHSKVLVLGVRLPTNYGVEYNTQFQQIFTDLVKRKDIVVVPLFLKGVDDKPKMIQADGIHPVAEAQAILMQNVWDELDKLLK